MISINSNIKNVRQSATLAINQHALQLRNQGQQITHFGFGQSPFPVHSSIQDALAKNSDKNEYLPTLGLPKLRKRIAEYFCKRGYPWQDHEIVIGPGSKELLFDFLMILDGILLLPAPSWVSYYPQARILDKRVVSIPCSLDTDYKLTQSALAKVVESLDPRQQKILLINSPNNPVGNVYSKDEMQQLAEYAQKHNLYILADEIYGQVSFHSKKAPSIAECIPERVIVTSGLSKAFSAGGYRLGFAAIPLSLDALIQPLTAVISETFSCVSSPIQYAAYHAYSDDADINNYIERCTKIHHAMATYIRDRLKSAGLACPEGQGGFYLFPDFNAHADALKARGIRSSHELCKVLLEEAQVLLLPAEDFGMPSGCYAARLATVDYKGETLLAALEKAGDEVNERTIAELIELAPSVRQGCDALEQWMKSLAQGSPAKA